MEDLGDQREDLGDQREDLGDQREDLGDRSPQLPVGPRLKPSDSEVSA